MSDNEAVKLNWRDREVLTLLAWGYTDQQVADELGVSRAAVKTYLRFAYRKIGVTHRAQAVAWGVRHGLAGDSHAASPAGLVGRS